MARATFSAAHAEAAPGGSSGEGMLVACPPPERVTLPPWLVTVISPSIRNTPYCPSIGPPQNSVPRTPISASGVETRMFLSLRLFMRPVEKKRPRRRFQGGLANAALGFVNVAIDDETRVLAEREHRVVAESDLEPRIRPGAQFVFHVNFRADYSGCGSRCRDDLHRVLDLVHPADRFGALRSGHAYKARGKQAENGQKTEARGKEAARRRFNALAEPSHRLEVAGRAGLEGRRFIIAQIRKERHRGCAGKTPPG